MTLLQVLYLRRLHGLTEAQASALAVLVWGAGTARGSLTWAAGK